MKVHVLGSGSAGNAIVVESERQRIMVDAGFGVRELGRRLKAADIDPASISALIVTHEHGDHANGAMTAARRWQWPLYATAGTLGRIAEERRVVADWTLGEAGEGDRAADLPVRRRRQSVTRHAVTAGHVITLEDFTVQFVKAPHDAREHVAVVITVNSTGERVGIAYDLGHVSERFIRHFADVQVLLLESNYDEAMLRTGPYPWSVKQRVAGPLGHLSNVEAGLMARACVHGGLQHLVLCHLSETNNRPTIALRAMKSALRGSAFRGTLQAAAQDVPVTLGGAVQMELAL